MAVDVAWREIRNVGEKKKVLIIDDNINFVKMNTAAPSKRWQSCAALGTLPDG